MKKIQLLLKSQKRIRNYAIVAKQIHEKRLEIINKIAYNAQKQDGNIDDTILLTSNDTILTSDDTVLNPDDTSLLF